MALLPRGVLVYSGPGASPACVASTVRAIASHAATDIPVQPVTPAQLEGTRWEQGTLCLVMPGGRDRPYVEHLGGAVASRIRRFVRDGGSYIGICAGAYFASAHCEFEKGTDLEVDEPRELGLFPGKAVGSTYGRFDYNSERGAFAARVRFRGAEERLPPAAAPPPPLEDQLKTRCYIEGGPAFELEFEEGVDVTGVDVRALAWYDDDDDAFEGGTGRRGALAALRCNAGNGAVVLCGPHPEMNLQWAYGDDPDPVDPDDLERSADLASQLRAHQPGGSELVRSLLASARIPLQSHTVLSYGALLSEASAKGTFPSLRNFRLVRVPGFQRVVAHPHIGLIGRGLIDPSFTKALGTLSAEPCASHLRAGSSAEGASAQVHAQAARGGADGIVCAAFEVDMTDQEMQAFAERESEYVLARVPFRPLSPEELSGGAPCLGDKAAAEETLDEAGAAGRRSSGLMCIASDDAAFRAAVGDDQYRKVVESVGGRVWSWERDSGLVPAPLYIRHCLLAAQAQGPAALHSLTDHTVLIDRKTKLGEWLEQAKADGVDVLAEGERQWEALPENSPLRVRFGG